MKRILFYIFRALAFISRFFGGKAYMPLICKAHRSQGVQFTGRPEYIHYDAYLDPSGGLSIAEGAVISTRTIILTHDWSFLKRAEQALDPASFEKKAYRPVSIGKDSFIGAGAIVLPGSTIEDNCIIGAGAVIKGHIKSGSIMAGNPAKDLSEKSLNRGGRVVNGPNLKRRKKKQSA